MKIIKKHLSIGFILGVTLSFFWFPFLTYDIFSFDSYKKEELITQKTPNVFVSLTLNKNISMLGTDAVLEVVVDELLNNDTDKVTDASLLIDGFFISDTDGTTNINKTMNFSYEKNYWTISTNIFFDGRNDVIYELSDVKPENFKLSFKLEYKSLNESSWRIHNGENFWLYDNGDEKQLTIDNVEITQIINSSGDIRKIKMYSPPVLSSDNYSLSIGALVAIIVSMIFGVLMTAFCIYLSIKYKRMKDSKEPQKALPSLSTFEEDKDNLK